jgi:hypothetical protein
MNTKSVMYAPYAASGKYPYLSLKACEILPAADGEGWAQAFVIGV